MKEIQLNLKRIRKSHNMSQEELAEKLGISRQSVIALEQGESFPSLPLIVEMLNYFDLPFDQIVWCEGNHLEKGGENKMARDITPWSPFRDVDKIHDTIDRMFEDSSFGARMPMVSVNIPVVNIRSTDKAVIVEAEIPGVDEKDLDIEIQENTLIISGHKKSEEEINEKNYFRCEFTYGSFSRAVALPVPVQEDKAEAVISKGTLKITLPKVEEQKPKGKKISISKK